MKISKPELIRKINRKLVLDVIRKNPLCTKSYISKKLGCSRQTVSIIVSNLNDEGIITSCEGDINASIIMTIFNFIHGNAILNSDIIAEDEVNNTIMFSHCGAGPFTCASSNDDIMLLEHYEVKSGLGVYYPVKKGGEEITIINLTGREQTYRMCVLTGKSIPIKELTYYGNPIDVKFNTKVEDLINIIGNEGFGHHWMVSYGNYLDIFKEISELIGINLVAID